MKQSIEFIITILHEEVTLYSATFAIFIAALVYLYFRKNEKTEMNGFMWLSMILILLFCFPPFTQFSLLMGVDSRQYLHLLWCLPVVSVISFVFVDYLYKQKNRLQRGIWIVFCMILLSYAGNFIYIPSYWYEEGYSFRNPDLDEQIEVCEFLHVYDANAYAVVRKEFLPLVRQVSGDIHLLYGTDIQEEGKYSEGIQELFQLMQTEDDGDMMKLIQRARELGAEYLIMDRWWESRQASDESVMWDEYVQVICETEHYQVLKI